MVVFVFVSSFSGQVLGQAIDVNDRFAHFQLQQAVLSESFSVLIEKISLDVDIVDVPRADTPGGKSEKQKRLVSNRILQRVVFGKKGQWKRLDGLFYSVFGSQDLGLAMRESQLIHENEGWYFRHSKNDRPNQSLRRFQIRAGITGELTETRWKHPFSTATTNGGGMLDDKENGWASMNFTVLEEELQKDGRTKFTTTNQGGGVHRFTFNKDEDWFVEEIEFLTRNQSQEELIAISMGAKSKPATKETLKDYTVYATNRSEWKEIEKNRWVPWVSRIHSKEGDYHVEHEIRFRDWKFMGDVNQSLLDEENFTLEKIPASVDFKAIRDLFDTTK